MCASVCLCFTRSYEEFSPSGIDVLVNLLGLYSWCFNITTAYVIHLHTNHIRCGLFSDITTVQLIPIVNIVHPYLPG